MSFAEASAQKNSYDFSQSISELIENSTFFQQIKVKTEKRKTFETDEEGFLFLTVKNKQEIANFILSIAVSVNEPFVSDNEIAIFCKNTKEFVNDRSIIAFLDGICVGVGTAEKGLFSKLPKDKYGKGFHELKLYYITASNMVNLVFSSPVDFSLKNFYQFEWRKGKIIRSN